MPRYELRARNHGPDNLELEVWQLPSSATPHIKSSLRLAGRNLSLVEHRVLRRLAKAGILISPANGAATRHELDEDLARMRSRTNIRQVTEGIEAMGKEEAAYWLGMAMHRKYPRRVLMALRFLLIDPRSE
ncbi:DUF7680 family protein [Desulfonatronum parangueonense]